MDFVCPRCKGRLEAATAAYRCCACQTDYPVIAGIPDFRLFADPYIDIDSDRAKGAALAESTAGMTFEQAVRYYYSITPDDPPDLAAVWTARALAEVDIARAMLQYAPGSGGLLDIGCSTGAVLIAAGGGAGVDIAFRWLVLGVLRLREAGLHATLVCANAEHLPFPSASFGRVTCFDTLEHLSDPKAALAEMRRTANALLLTSNNRWALVPEAHVRLWGVGWLPRRLQRRYVAWRRGDLHPYRIILRGPREGARLLRETGWNARVEAAPMYGPHLGPAAGHILRLHRMLRRLPGMRWVSPRWLAREAGHFGVHESEGDAAAGG